jgi:hypothetical protein
MQKFIITTIYEYLNEQVNIPNILYHTSNEFFNKFKLKQGYRTHLLSVEKTNSYAIFLSDNIEATKNFGKKYLYKCEINVKRILDWSEYLDERSYAWIEKKFKNIIPYDCLDYWMLLDNENVINYLKHRGIDCIILNEYKENILFTTYSILNPINIQILDIEKLSN